MSIYSMGVLDIVIQNEGHIPTPPFNSLEALHTVFLLLKDMKLFNRRFETHNSQYVT